MISRQFLFGILSFYFFIKGLNYSAYYFRYGQIFYWVANFGGIIVLGVYFFFFEWPKLLPEGLLLSYSGIELYIFPCLVEWKELSRHRDRQR